MPDPRETTADSAVSQTVSLPMRCINRLPIFGLKEIANYAERFVLCLASSGY